MSSSTLETFPNPRPGRAFEIAIAKVWANGLVILLATGLSMFLIVQMVPLEALVIPLFVQVRDLGMLNTLLGLMVVYVALSLPFGIWMLRGFVAAVPVELEEAAYIDGASWGRMFRSVLLPLVMPGLVATSVFSFITAWNEFIFAMTLLGAASENYTVAIGLKQAVGAKDALRDLSRAAVRARAGHH